ncbi:MAG: alkaline phosphatase family protein, partial [Planctomycetaceae bacterium]
LSEVNRPVHLNRVLRQAGYLTVRKEITGWESLDCGASRAFAVADHQVAQIYVRRPQDVRPVAELLRKTAGVEQVLDRSARVEAGIDHERSGELVAVSDRESWFTYYFWQDDAVAPDYARTVDIHRKPGYDPVELFIDPELKLPGLKVARRLMQKLAGFRYSMDVIGLDARIVRGSHGRVPDSGHEIADGPVFVCSSKKIECDTVALTDVKQMLLQLQFGLN